MCLCLGKQHFSGCNIFSILLKNVDFILNANNVTITTKNEIAVTHKITYE